MVLILLSTIFQLYHGGQFYWWKKAEYLEKTIDCRKSLTTFFAYILVILYRVHLAMSGVRTHDFKLMNLYLSLYLYAYVVEALLGYETTGVREHLVAYRATTCS